MTPPPRPITAWPVSLRPAAPSAYASSCAVAIKSRRLIHAAAAALLCLGVASAQAQSLLLSLGDIEGTDWKAHEVHIALNFGAASRVQIARLDALGRTYTKLSLTCAQLLVSESATRCRGGMLEMPEKLPVEFSYDPRARSLAISVAPGAQERWDIKLAGAESTLQLQNASLVRLALWVPGDFKPNAGRVSGTARFTALEAHADLRLEDAGFADTPGLHAGEKLAGSMKIDARRAQPTDAWQWKLAASWDKGAVFWDPVYLSNAGHTIEGEGEYAGNTLTARRVATYWPHLGRFDSDFTLDLKSKRFTRVNLSGKGLTLVALRELVPQDWLEKHDLADLTMAGSADIEFRQVGERIERLHMRVADAGIEAQARRLRLRGLRLLIDYDEKRAGPFQLEIAELRLRGLAAGPVKTKGEFRDERLSIPSMLIPMLDGVLVLNEIAIADQQGEFAAELRGAFTPLSMDKLTTALDLLPMSGTISAVIPKMTYAKSTLKVDGALLFKVFDGDASVDRIRLENPFGRTPRLTANLSLRGMDLEQMTGAVKFGNITGKVDVDIKDLEMENWQPISFDARVLTSPGDFKKRISQRAVQNISSIGGAGAGAAIQASFLRVFQTFGYDKIGLSCKLVNGICELGGAENAAQGFVIIKGGGIPAVSVVGYNRRVGWQEMLARIKAVIDGNSKMVIQ